MNIVLLSKDKYKGYPLKMDYSSDYYFDVELHNGLSVNNFFITKQKFEETFYRTNQTDYLYEDHFDNAYAYGMFEDESLIGIIEINYEHYNNRVRVVELWVKESYRDKGIASKLLNYVKELVKDDYRAIILETQSSNYKAINLYIKNGFSIVGLDTIAYYNDDINRREVRLEFGYIFD